MLRTGQTLLVSALGMVGTPLPFPPPTPPTAGCGRQRRRSRSCARRARHLGTVCTEDVLAQLQVHCQTPRTFFIPAMHGPRVDG
ncbi:hypothetical protein DFH09DRAFT_1144501 [Mycena vulgaris]|nr:hypothetical protein DFH09DRAFT_1144501 [Mycena vulgaris]